MNVRRFPHILAAVCGAAACAIAALSQTGCFPERPPGPTPPPGFAVAPKPAVLSIKDIGHAWKQVMPGTHGLVIESDAPALIDVVQYRTSSAVADPSKDNLRLVIAGSGSCDVGRTRIAVAPRDVVVTPRGVVRSCKASAGELTFLNASIARTQFDEPPPGGRIRLDRLLALLRSHNGDVVTATIERTTFCTVAAARIRLLAARPATDNEVLYVIAGDGILRRPPAQTTRVRTNDLVVLPQGTIFALQAGSAPLEALQIDVKTGAAR